MATINKGSVLFDEAAISTKVLEIANKIKADYATKNPVIIAMLKGSMYFACDLTKMLDMPLQIDFLTLDVLTSRGSVKIEKDIEIDITGRHVLLVDVIINTGLTMSYIIQYLEMKKPASIELCTLLNNSASRLVSLPISYSGFDIPDRELVGYGLDREQYFRNLPYIVENLE